LEKCLYIFIDESGNFDFTVKGTKYFVFSCITKERPFMISESLDELKFDLIENGLNIEYFHATEDKKYVRNKVYDIICRSKNQFEINSLIVEKRKTHPKLQDPIKFYPQMLGYLLNYVLNKIYITAFKEILVITDSVPNSRHGKALEKTIAQTVGSMLKGKTNYRIMHHSSKSCFSLQITDYCNYAIYRKWERNDFCYYDLLKSKVKSEINIFEKEVFY
jgi:hypothetical protein